jgi:hypothetical protein
MSQPADPNIIKLRNVCLSFPKLYVPESVEEGGTKKYSAVFLLDVRQHADVIAQIEKVTERVALDEFKRKIPLKYVPLRDGNEKPEMEGYGDGVMFVSAKSEVRPVVVDGNLNPVAQEDGLFYAGCYVNANIRLFAYDHKTGGKGVAAGLRSVQFVKDGPPFGAGNVNPEDEFEKLSIDDELDSL